MNNDPAPCLHRRILVIDDNLAIHDDFRKILGQPDAMAAKMQAVEARLFGTRPTQWFEVDAASQGKEGLQMVQRAMAEGQPYSVAFVDFRMPPGWDGLETAKHLWAVCPDLQIVICTAYAECSWSEALEQIKPGDRLLILKKPFDTIEALQLASSLTEKWRVLQESRCTLDHLDQLVKQRTQDLETSRLNAMSMMEEAVRNHEREKQACEDLRREVEMRKRLEDQFREKASLLDMARDAILVQDLEFRITYWNKSAEQLYGWTTTEALGRLATDLYPPDPIDFEEACRRVMQTGEWLGPLQQVAKDGKNLLIEGRWTLVRGADGQPKCILAINTDVTQQRQMEQHFLRSQRMESIGALAGGIAHDLNNVLTPITMAVDCLKLKVTDTKCLKALDSISTSARRGADMVGQVLLFARGMEGRRIIVQPEQLIDDIKTMCLEVFPKDIQVETSISPALWALHGDPTQLHQLLVNLCVNARDAMPQGGRLAIRATNMMIHGQQESMNPGAAPRPHVIIEVEDTGTGIPDDVVKNVFDPFFTTKEQGKGTGLGLSTSLTIVKSHGGSIHVDSEPGRGTRFRIHLPATADEPTECVKEDQAPALPRGNNEMVLVVDDEAFVREMTRQTLEAYGYQVMLASEGTEAVALYAKHRNDISVVLTDMMMPIMDGANTTSVLMGMNPSVRVIAASGDTTDDNIERAHRAGAKYFLPKPFSGETLLPMLNQVLEEDVAAHAECRCD